MTLAQLRYFCTAARYHSITQAANILFVTQPTVSIAIRDLEREFSITLFTHAGGSLTLTDEGEAFYDRASEILSQCDDLITEYDGSKPVQNRFSIGIPPMLSTIFFPELLDGFHAVYPDIWVELQEYGSVRACQLVQNDVLDMGLVNMELHDIDKFHTFYLTTEPTYLGVSPTHPLAGEPCISLEQLQGQPLILYNQDSVQNQIFLSQFQSRKVSPHIIMRSSQITTILKFLRQGKCCCFFYKSMFEQLPELVGIPLVPPVETRVGLVWRRGRYMTAGMRAFLDFCKQWRSDKESPLI